MVQLQVQEQAQVESAERKEIIETPVKTVFKKFGNNRDVSLVFGDPIEVGLTKVVPVAKLRYGFGGGGDNAGNNGGGGGFIVNPVGVYEITPERVRFKSTRNYERIIGLVLLFGLFFVLGRKLSRKK
ncbi:spore germination protein GerW family protein [Sporosarcina sp. UB5]|uniref:spore germination protein GerW family protein n=1 Tax=Sporosarcina sp. UB5 TaxID=3047463 RepID=UPI003D7AF3E6